MGTCERESVLLKTNKIERAAKRLKGEIAMRYVTRDREAGNVIEGFATVEAAKKALIAYEEQDKKEGTYTEDFYEIYDTENEEIL